MIVSKKVILLFFVFLIIFGVYASTTELSNERKFYEGVLEIVYIDDFKNQDNSHYIYYINTGNKKYQINQNKDIENILPGSKISLIGKLNKNIITNLKDIKIIENRDEIEENFGVQNTLVILTGIGESEPVTTIEILNNTFFNENSPSVKNYYEYISFNQTTFQGDVVGPYQLSENITTYDELTSAVFDRVLEEGINLTNYSRIAISHPDYFGLNNLGYASIGFLQYNLSNGQILTASIAWSRAQSSVGTWIHELGHNFGLRHASNLLCYDIFGNQVPISQECEPIEYGNPFDVMGTGLFHHHLNAPHKFETEWLSEENIILHEYNIGENHTYLIKPIEIQTEEIQLVKIPLINYVPIDNIEGEFYYTIEFRQPFNYDNITHPREPVFYNGALIHISRLGFSYPYNNYLITVNPEEPDYSNYLLEEGETFIDEINGIIITTNSVSEEGVNVTVGYIEPISLDCEDGTLNGMCSDEQPLYCNSGYLVSDCGNCGCFGYENCGLGNTCYEVQCEHDGDVNLDGNVNVLDIVSIIYYFRHNGHLSNEQQCRGDINEDLELTMEDIENITSKIMRIDRQVKENSIKSLPKNTKIDKKK